MVAVTRPDVTLYPQARRTAIEIVYAGKDVSADLAPYLKGLSWSESLSGAADDLQISLHDRDRLWATDWRPQFGDVVEAAIEAESWVNGGRTMRLPLGRVLIDELELSGPPAGCALKAVSAGLSTGLRRTKRTRAWQGVTLQDIAQDIADRAGLELLFSAPDFGWSSTTTVTEQAAPSAAAQQAAEADGVDPAALAPSTVRRQVVKHKRIDQKHESDLSFLLRLAEEVGLAVKVTDGQLAVFAEADLEAGTPVTTLSPGLSNVLRWRLRDSTTDRYVSCAIRYRDPLTGRVVEGIAGETHRESRRLVPDEPCLRETRRVEDKEHAERLARQQLKAAQDGATLASFSVVGDPSLVSGVVVGVDGIYGMEGNYLATDTVHSAVGGYTTELSLRRILGG